MDALGVVLNLARLRVFEAVVRTGSFAAAADALSFTPSAISQQMARLEAEVGILLVERTARGVQLTPAGELLHLRAQRILAEAQEAFAELNALAGLRSGRLRIGSFPSATQAFTTGVLKAYRERFPGVDVVLVEDEPHHNLARLRDREIDLALLFSWPGRPIGLDYRNRRVCSDEGVTLSKLADDPYVAILPDGHRLADREGLTVGDLRDELIVGSRWTPGLDQLTELAQERGFEPLLTGHEIPDYESVRAFVATGDGIAVIPSLAAARGYPGTMTRRLHGDVPTRVVHLAQAQGGVLSAAAAAMAAVIGELAADLPRQLAGERSPAASASGPAG
ncbi:MAG TPA: LysR family transcriptional regulator [Solirubrobacteraceae bacterium]|nr:LysR family transcriptional regulator [Solirubrobacteraceae bacterium]